MLFTAVKERLNKELRDSDNSTFTDDEKTEALTRAIEEDVVALPEEDSSVTFVNGTRSYNLATTIRAIYSIGLDSNGNGYPSPPIDAEAYDFIAPRLIFTSRWAQNVPDGSVLYIQQLRKLTISDDIPDVFVPYVINMGIYYTTELLSSGKVNRFIRNDTTLSEIQARGATAMRTAQRLKKALPSARFVAV